MVEAILGLVAVIIAVRQLVLQRNEIRRNGQINSLVHVASVLQHRIDYHEKIIGDLRAQRKSVDLWHGHQKRVNSELRPLLADVHRQLLGLMVQQDMPFAEDRILKALALNAEVAAG